MAKRLRSPVHWYGGKGKMVAKLLPLLSVEHQTYVEPFGGAASLLFAKPPSPVEVYNDIDSGLVNFFRVLQNPEHLCALYRKLVFTPYAREIYNEFRNTWQDQEDSIERAYQWFVVARMSFSGAFSASWSSAITHGSRGMLATASKWQTAVQHLPYTSARLWRVQIEQQDWRVILKRYDRPATLFYLDPPYPHASRKSRGYEHELTDQDHKELVKAAIGLEGMVLLSSYRSPLYNPLCRAGWKKLTFNTACHAAAKTKATGILGKGSALRMQKRTEVVWLSPRLQESLERV